MSRRTYSESFSLGLYVAAVVVGLSIGLLIWSVASPVINYYLTQWERYWALS